MTYARSRLRLGIFGVGSIVTVSFVLLVGGFAHEFLPVGTEWSYVDFSSLAMLIGVIVIALLPLDVVGGFVLPRVFHRSTVSVSEFFRSWWRGVLVQTAVFFGSGLVILLAGRLGGRLSATFAIVFMSVALIASQRWIASLIMGRRKFRSDLGASDEMTLHAQPFPQGVPIVSIENDDPGFTGGIVGSPGHESIIVPETWERLLSREQLSITIARRLEAINTGSRTRGLAVAMLWNSTGFLTCSYLPGAGVTSVAELVTTCFGFTCWTFLGLLILPTISRQASYAIDRNIIDTLGTNEPLMATLKILDQLQDDEPERAPSIETIFHPVPSLENRRLNTSDAKPFAWHAARTMLFLSWACLGVLSRAVHCNVGRPELWGMLPTD